ncbi:amino-acid acetyltransferase [mine drainage metagenome]|uniref:amino-acid N-acetyltransferase n=1 Tax=mine drainage metagenome TaxID=410659 RepID=A0A1J5TD75_9ZZZZ
MSTVAVPPASSATIKPTDLRGILKYVPRFKDQIFIIALDGLVVADENFPNLLVDIAVLRSLAIKVVLVHGIGQQIQELSKMRGIPITNHDGSGVTDAATLDLGVRASARVSHLILEGLTQNSLKAAITNSIRALPIGIIRGVDQQFTAKVERIDRDLINHLLDADVIPIVSPIGFGPDGRSLRINSDLLAAELAESLQASKIIYLTEPPGLVINGELKREISVDALRAILRDHPEQIEEGWRSKASQAVKTIESGTPRVHVVDGTIFDGLLNEIFSNEGVGSLIYGNDYQQIRQATRRDVRFIYNLTRSAVRREELLYRSQQAIEKNIDQFYVFEIDEAIIACVTLYFYPDKPELAELGSLYVMPFYQKRGIGKKMVEFACYQAKERGARTIIALSTQSFGFFTNTCGFEEAETSVLPVARLRLYTESGRNPRVLVKPL